MNGKGRKRLLLFLFLRHLRLAMKVDTFYQINDICVSITLCIPLIFSRGHQVLHADLPKTVYISRNKKTWWLLLLQLSAIFREEGEKKRSVTSYPTLEHHRFTSEGHFFAKDIIVARTQMLYRFKRNKNVEIHILLRKVTEER